MIGMQLSDYIELNRHCFLGLPAAKPRVWIDLSSAESKRAGLAMHSPGRKLLRWAVKVLGWFAWLPIEKIIRGPVKRFDELPGSEVMERIFSRVECEKDGKCLAAKNAKGTKKIEYLTLYMGNDSAKTKLTVMVGLSRSEKARLKRAVIVKLGKTKAAAEAIRNEVRVLKLLSKTSLCNQVPEVIGEVSGECEWTWSVQSVLPKGKSPVRVQNEHYEFLEELKKVGLSHGDFAPWNCSIVGGKLYVWDWEDAESWTEGKDEFWFKKQVKELLGIDDCKIAHSYKVNRFKESMH